MPQTDRPRQRAVREDHIRNHEKLLDAAVELFDKQGVDVPLKEIGAHANVSQASVFRHFANREQLIIELYDRSSTDLTNRLLAAIAGTRDATAAHRLDVVFTTVVDTVTDHPSYGRLAALGATLNPDRTTEPALVEELHQLIGDAQHAGLLASDVTGFDLIVSPMLVGSMLTQSAGAAAMVPRMMTIMRRGLTPQTTGTPSASCASTISEP
ncbi:TetR/AcrR family transcriptional regulator [Paramicrobacterium chengjingii]|uniref:TetR/AcrR family transcriptional regulator n=1 Tax=Paramicrobacterium chengjingii TaxID=2769067 RepID=UPI00142139A8|nr:TetR/AcrR family transcriptional regulator [Microbacterium chengjingii]